MRWNTWRTVGSVFGGAVLVAVLAIPAIVLIVQPIREGVAPTDEFVISAKQWRLLADSLKLALGGTIVSLLLALPGEFGWGSSDARDGRNWSFVPAGVVLWLLMGCLISPMVYSFGWQQTFGLVGVNRPRGGRMVCALVWGSWIWPVPALIIGSAWRRCGHEAYEAALLGCSRGQAFFSVALPLLGRHVLVAMLIVFVLLCGEYVVPHAWGLRVYATELLGWSTDSTRIIDAVWPVWPLLACMGVLGAVALFFARSFQSETPAAPRMEPSTASKWPTVLCLSVFAVTVALPILGLIWRLGSWDAMAQSWQVHGGDLLRCLRLMLMAGCAAAGMAVGLLFVRPIWRVAMVVAIIFGVLPGALVGEAVYATFGLAQEIMPGGLGRAGPWNDHWVMVVVGMTAKYAWIAFLIIGAAMMGREPELDDQASTDGATRGEVMQHIRLARHAPAMLCAVLVVAAFALADVAVATQVQVSSVRPVSLLLVEAMHRFEDEMLISISLWLVVAAMPGALLSVWAIRRE